HSGLALIPRVSRPPRIACESVTRPARLLPRALSWRLLLRAPSQRPRFGCVEMEAAPDGRRHNDASSHAREGAVLVGYARVATADEFEALKVQTHDLRAAGAERILTEYGCLSSPVAP